MKKVILSLILISCIFILVGCRSKNSSNKTNIFDNKEEVVENNKDNNKVDDNKIDDTKVDDTKVVDTNDYVICTQKANGVDITMTTTMRDSYITSMDVRWNMDLSEYTTSQANVFKGQDLCATLKLSMSNYTFNSCKQTTIGNELVINANIDVSSITTSRTTPTEVKTSLENVGYICVIK